jgi:hypothetical protein
MDMAMVFLWFYQLSTVASELFFTGRLKCFHCSMIQHHKVPPPPQSCQLTYPPDAAWTAAAQDDMVHPLVGELAPLEQRGQVQPQVRLWSLEGVKQQRHGVVRATLQALVHAALINREMVRA